jgi:hypothetical protein
MVWYWRRKAKVPKQNNISVPHWPPQIPHGLAQAWNRPLQGQAGDWPPSLRKHIVEKCYYSKLLKNIRTVAVFSIRLRFISCCALLRFSFKKRTISKSCTTAVLFAQLCYVILRLLKCTLTQHFSRSVVNIFYGKFFYYSLFSSLTIKDSRL